MAEELHLDKNEAVYNWGVCTQSMPVDIQCLIHRGLQERGIGLLIRRLGWQTVDFLVFRKSRGSEIT